jgi:hypothetical protein
MMASIVRSLSSRPLAALDSIEALRRYSPDITIGKIASSLPLTQDFLDRVAEGLDKLGLST